MNTYKMNESWVRIIIGCCIWFTFKFSLRECKSVANILFIFIDSFIHSFVRRHSSAFISIGGKFKANSSATTKTNERRRGRSNWRRRRSSEKSQRRRGRRRLFILSISVEIPKQRQILFILRILWKRERGRQRGLHGERERKGGKEGAEYSEWNPVGPAWMQLQVKIAPFHWLSLSLARSNTHMPFSPSLLSLLSI